MALWRLTAILILPVLPLTGCGPVDVAEGAPRPTDGPALSVRHPQQGYSLDLSDSVPPRRPLAGALGGHPFVLDRVEHHADTNVLVLYGNGHDGAIGPVIFVFLPEEIIPGLALELETPKRAKGYPHVHLHHVELAQDDTVFTHGFVFQLDVGRSQRGVLPARLSLCLPDEQESWIAGSFDLPVR